jgi:hypothetical protein
VKVLKWFVVVVVVLAAIFFVLIVGTSHGHIDEFLVVTVRITDRDSGRPLEGALVATVRYRSTLEQHYFERALDEAIDAMGLEDAWRLGFVAATRSASEESTVIRTSAYVTRYWVGPVEVSKTVFPPEVLLIDHSRLGRTIVSIDPKRLAEGSEGRTWRLDVGTVTVPQ